jgi:uncharacterized linocin/CFP29 family protein
MDFIVNGKANGSVANTLLGNGFDIGALRPWIGKDGRSYVARNNSGILQAVPTNNTTATLRKDEWKILDDAIIPAAKERLRLVADVRSAGLTFNIPNGMGKTVLETETVSDLTAATISMDPARKSEGDRPEYELTNLPLPVIHKDFYFSARQVATSRNSGASIDVTSAQLAARRVAEEVEKLATGTAASFTYGGGTVYGLTNFPSRITKSDITPPTETGWTPQMMVQEVLAMRQLSENALHYGPWVLYTSSAWDEYLDDDYSSSKGDNTLRQRLIAINGINGVRTLDHLATSGTFALVLCQMTSDVIREVIGMDITTVQWESEGGMRLNFKVMAIMVPQLRADFNGNTGIVHGTTS